MTAKLYHASCKCGSIRYLARVDTSSTVACICARCRGQGLRVAHLSSADFTLMNGGDNLTESLRDARTPHHFFCRTCGEASFGVNGDTVSVNIACLERGDIDAVSHSYKSDFYPIKTLR